jgi:ATP-dependent Clp protease ATP-binding subunit ClpC
LARGEICCIGATTAEEYRKSIARDGALERRFQTVNVRPNTPEETYQILLATRETYSRHHHAVYPDESLRACVALSERYLTGRAFPDKALDVVDEAGARKAALHGKQGKPADITPQDIATVVSLMSGVPVTQLAAPESRRLLNMDQALLREVIGQDEAVHKVVRAIRRSRLGLQDPQRPIGTFLFLGPTGVGKTWLARCLAKEMFGTEDALIRFDMSEYMEKHTLSLLVGAPPGYVAYEEGGKLTEAVHRRPYSVVLFDEIEKAHPDIFNILLQVMDEGRLTDRQGRQTDFRHTVIILTSNAGTRQLRDFGNGIGFQAEALSEQQSDRTLHKALQRTFPPEFTNRIDDVVIFHALDRQTVEKIIDREIQLLKKRMKAAGHRLTVAPEVQTALLEKAFDPQNGARPVRRAVQTWIEDPLAARLLKNPKQKTIRINTLKQL